MANSSSSSLRVSPSQPTATSAATASSGRRSGRRLGYGALAAVLAFGAPLGTLAFVSSSKGVAKSSPSMRENCAFLPSSVSYRPASAPSPTQLNMFMGSDGGILGIGTPELFTILLVGYFVLGPSDLYKLTKEIGKFVQNFRTFTTEATASLENNFESQLQLEEIRKAQRELNEAFSFRRSINVEPDTDPFEVNAKSPRMPEQTAVAATVTAAVATAEDEEATASAAPKKKIRRRRVKKVMVPDPVEEEEEEDDPFCVPTGNDMSAGEVVTNVPDLSVEDEVMNDSEEDADRALREASEQLRKEALEEEAAERRRERIERLQQASTSSEEEMEAANARFQNQLTSNWNDQILSKGEELSPLASIMDRLALLEQEKQAADERLQEEFRLREENEERFYREKRKLLEEAAAQVQADVYLNPKVS